jgi:ABC-2 type transport system permease protein
LEERFQEKKIMNALDIARKDIQQILRDWKSALFLIVMPVLFTIFFGLVFGPVLSGDQKTDPRLPVGWINKDPDGLLSDSLQSLLASSEVIRPVPLDDTKAGDASSLVAKGDLAAVIRVPEGYSAAIFADQPASLQVIADQTTAGGRTAVTALDTVTGKLLGAVESAHLSVEVNQDSTRLQTAFQQAIAAWKEPPLTVRVEQATGSAARNNLAGKITGFTQSSAGMMVQFAIFGLINSAMLLVLERKTRCLQRLLTTPVRRAQIIGGHILAIFAIVFCQELILVTLGQFVFGVDYLREPAAILLMMVVLALWAASLGLLIGALARKEDQVIVLCLVAMFIFSALGGAWFPLDVAGKAFATIGHTLPTAWAMDGFQNIVMRGLGFTSVLMPAGILLAYMLSFFGLALWRFKFE